MSAQQTRPEGQSETLKQGVGMPPLEEKIDDPPPELVLPPYPLEEE
jgi:hypothetical protein